MMTVLIPVDYPDDDPRPDMQWEQPYQLTTPGTCSVCATPEVRTDLTVTKHVWGGNQTAGHLMLRCPDHQRWYTENPPVHRVRWMSGQL